MRLTLHRTPDSTPLHHGWIGGLVGGTLAFALGAIAYSLLLAIVPADAEGLAWNVVPLVTVLGTVLGWWYVRSHVDHDL
jgi:hypothetical protein